MTIANFKNKPKVSDLQADLNEAQPSHSKHKTDVKSWLNALDIEGSSKIQVAKGRSSVQPKLIRKQAEWRYAPLSEPFLSTPDMFRVRPVTHGDLKAAHQNQALLNYQFSTQINRTYFIDQYVRTAVNTGSVVVRVGWERVEETVNETFHDIDLLDIESDEQMAILQSDVDMMERWPDEFSKLSDERKHAARYAAETGKATYGVVKRTYVKPVKRNKVNRPTLEVCDYRNIIIDPTCKGDISKARFVIQAIDTSLAELKAAGIYSNLDKIEKGSVTSSLLDEGAKGNVYSEQFTFKDNARKRFTVHEYWGEWDIDGNGTTVPIVAAWTGDTLIRLERNPFPDGRPPFVLANYMPVLGEVYGEPDAELLNDNQRIAGAITRGMIDLLGRSANAQMGVAKNMLDPINKRRFEAGEDYEFNPNANPAVAMITHKFPEIPNSALMLLTNQNAEAESLTGVKAFSTGGGITGAGMGNTTVAAKGALDAASKREMGILRRLARGVIEIGRKVIGLNAIYLSEEEVIRVTDEQFVTIRRDDLNGNIDLDLSVSTAEDDESKAAQMAFMLQTASNDDFGLRKIILSEIARLRKMPELAAAIDSFEPKQPEPDPLDQQIKQLQIMKLQAEIEALRADAMESAAKAQVQGAKVNVEHARAANLQSSADKQDLDYIERMEGITHNRELEKIQTQNKSKREIADMQVMAKTFTNTPKNFNE